MILQKVTFFHKDRNAVSVDDFYYRGYEDKLMGKKGTGVRRVAAELIKQGKILDRFLVLLDNGCRLEIHTIFKDRSALEEFISHDITDSARDFWKDREWVKTVELIEIKDFLSVRSKLVIP